MAAGLNRDSQILALSHMLPFQRKKNPLLLSSDAVV